MTRSCSRSRFAAASVVTLCAVGAAPVFADGAPVAAWSDLLTPSPFTSTSLVRFAPDGDVYVAGRLTDADQTTDILLARYSDAGELLWLRTYEGPVDLDDNAHDLEITPEGVSVVGTSVGERGPQTVLLNYTADGEFLGENRTIGPDFAGFGAPQLALGADGCRVIATDDNNGAGVLEAYTVDGEQLYSIPLEVNAVGGVSALAVGPDHSVFLVTIEDGPAPGLDMAYIARKYDENGVFQWSQAFPGETGLVLSEALIVPLPDGGAVFAGSPEIGCPTIKTRVWRQDADGAVLWQRDLPDQTFCAFGVLEDLDLAPAGDAVFVTISGAFPVSHVVRLGLDGETDWSRTIGGLVNVRFRSLAPLEDGRVVVGGLQSPLGDVIALDLRFDCFAADGGLDWTTTVAGQADEADFFADVVGQGRDVAIVGGLRNVDNTLLDGFVTHLTFAGCAGDLSGDDVVTAADLALLLAAWGSDDPVADLTGDDVVDGADLAVLLAAWGSCD